MLMDWYKLPVSEVKRRLDVNEEEGMEHEEVERRRQLYGKNQLTGSKRMPMWLVFLKQFQDFLVMILLAATLIAGLLGEYIDALAIMLIVLLNGVIGFVQENKAEKSLEKLKQLSAPNMRVLRHGEWVTLPAEDAVVGDIVRMTDGDRVPADLRMMQVNSLETEESMLTGESLPVAKSTAPIKREKLALQDQKNLAFKSTLVTKGFGRGIVVQTGMQTE